MATDILWSDIVGTAQTIDDGGYAGDLMKLAGAHINEAVTSGRLAQDAAGQVYTNMIPAAFQSAIKFGMEEHLLEANTDKAIADAAGSLSAADNEYAKMLAEIDKVYGFSYTLDVDSNIVRSSLVDTADGRFDWETAEVLASTIRNDAQSAEQVNKIQYEISTLLPDQHVTNTKQQTLLDADEKAKQYEISTLLPDQHVTNTKQQTLLDTDEKAKQYEVDNILPEKFAKLQEEVDLLQSQDLEMLASTERNDEAALVERKAKNTTTAATAKQLAEEYGVTVVVDNTTALVTITDDLTNIGLAERKMAVQEASAN